MSSSDVKPAFCITLVHGTFADSSIWKQDFLHGIEQEFAGPVLFSMFPWSGKNSQLKRLEAGRDLQRHLTELVAVYPEARHFVIGHSHGGNLALYAVRNPRLQSALHGIVCLGTPFLVTHARMIELTAGMMLNGLTALVAAFALRWTASAYIWFCLWTYDLHVMSGTMFVTKIVAGFLLVVLVTSVLKFTILKFFAIVRWYFGIFFGVPALFIRRWQNRVLARYPRMRLGRVAMLYVFFERRDSAHRWLRVWAWFADLPRLTLSFIVLPCALFGNVALMMYFLWRNPTVPSGNGVSGILWIGAELLFVLLWIAVGLANAGFLAVMVQLAIIISGSVRNGVWSFGREGIFSTWLITIRSSQDPVFQDRKAGRSRAIPFTCDVEQMTGEDSIRGLLFRQYHSFYYRSPAIAKQIAQWMVTESAHRVIADLRADLRVDSRERTGGRRGKDDAVST